MSAGLREFLEIPYDELEELNLAAKAERLARKDPGTIQDERLKYLADEKRIKAVTVCFTDLEGRVAHARLRQEVPAASRPTT